MSKVREQAAPPPPSPDPKNNTEPKMQNPFTMIGKFFKGDDEKKKQKT